MNLVITNNTLALILEEEGKEPPELRAFAPRAPLLGEGDN